MTIQKEVVEQRQHKRFRVRDDAFVMLKPPDTGTGRLIDISMGGLTFEHVSSRASPIEATELDICLTGSTFILYDVQCRSIWELSIYEKSDTPLYRRRYGVQFDELTTAQIRLLEYFIENHTMGEV